MLRALIQDALKTDPYAQTYGSFRVIRDGQTVSVFRASRRLIFMRVDGALLDFDLRTAAEARSLTLALDDPNKTFIRTSHDVMLVYREGGHLVGAYRREDWKKETRQQ